MKKQIVEYEIMEYEIIDALISDSFARACELSINIDVQVRGIEDKDPDKIIKSCHQLLECMYQAKALLEVGDIALNLEMQQAENRHNGFQSNEGI